MFLCFQCNQTVNQKMEPENLVVLPKKNCNLSTNNLSSKPVSLDIIENLLQSSFPIAIIKHLQLGVKVELIFFSNWLVPFFPGSKVVWLFP